MTARNRVLRSIETDHGARCVDIFLRPDGSFGFEEYRLDGEDLRGWFPIGHHADGRQDSEAGAIAAARLAVPWFGDALNG